MENSYKQLSPVVRADLAYNEALRQRKKGRFQKAEALYSHSAALFRVASSTIDGKDADDLEQMAAFCETQAQWCSSVGGILANCAVSPAPDTSPSLNSEQQDSLTTSSSLMSVKSQQEADDLVNRLWEREGNEDDHALEYLMLDIAKGGGEDAQRVVSALLCKLQELRLALNTMEQECDTLRKQSMQ